MCEMKFQEREKILAEVASKQNVLAKQKEERDVVASKIKVSQ